VGVKQTFRGVGHIHAVPTLVQLLLGHLRLLLRPLGRIPTHIIFLSDTIKCMNHAGNNENPEKAYEEER
jgi:hypothetical protein